MRRRTRIIGAVAALAAAAVLVALARLGPANVWWSVVAWARPAPVSAAWRHVPDGSPVLVAVEPGELLRSPVAQAVRPQLDELARLHGFDVAIAESGIRHAVAVFDGTGRGYLVGTGVGLAPGLLPRLDERWRAVDPDGATDGEIFIAGIAPGVTLASRADAAEDAMRRAREAAGRGRGPILLPLDAPDSALAADVTPDEALRREMEHYLPREGDYLAREIVRAGARVAAGTDLSIALSIEHASEATARRTEELLRQVDAAARLARQLGPVARLVLKGDAALVTEIPPLGVSRDGATVGLEMDVPPEQLGRWIDLLLERARARLAPPGGP